VTLSTMPTAINGKVRKVNKSEWIRSQPATLSAKDVVSKAKAEGINLTPAQVYTTRSVANRKPAGAGRRGRPVGSVNRPKDDTEATFRRFVLKLGLDRVESMLAQFKRGAGL
jgi:hypothetical protein